MAMAPKSANPATSEVPTTDPSEILSLSSASDWTLRRQAALNPSASSEILNNLASDPTPGVRKAVALNPSTSTEILTRLSEQDSDRNIQAEAFKSLRRRGDRPVAQVTGEIADRTNDGSHESPGFSQRVPNPAVSPQPIGEQSADDRPPSWSTDQAGIRLLESQDSPVDIDAAMQRLERLSSLREAGHLTDDEFIAIKRAVMEKFGTGP